MYATRELADSPPASAQFADARGHGIASLAQAESRGQDTTRALWKENEPRTFQIPVSLGDAQALVLVAADAGVIAMDQAELLLRALR